ncbi:hypothetical protein BJ875DRAFT_545767 [Amylocarpus encephaloides]|uniref:Uncharacterized protein n=1 Tax=Amylocarpus encephaloides TaxID=45428 RepID=A0A9P7YDE3_9HELO|nr:hypothetical protein BJ875DRAFT_545767 [Amylocarpus encephaloides]
MHKLPKADFSRQRMTRELEHWDQCLREKDPLRPVALWEEGSPNVPRRVHQEPPNPPEDRGASSLSTNDILTLTFGIGSSLISFLAILATRRSHTTKNKSPPGDVEKPTINGQNGKIEQGIMVMEELRLQRWTSMRRGE